MRNIAKMNKVSVGVLSAVLIAASTLSLTACDTRAEEYLKLPAKKQAPVNHPNKKSARLRKQDQIWERLRQNYDINPKNKQIIQNARVQHFVKQYQAGKTTIDNMGTKASPYLYYIMDEIEKRDMPGEIALLPMIESAFEAQANSHAGAAGLWQFMPKTGRHFGLKQDQWYDGRRDVKASTKAALDYLELLHGQFNNDWMLALAAYNAGEGRIQKAIQKNKKKGKPTNYWSLDIPNETKQYVPKLLALAEVVGNPEKHKVALPVIENKPYFEAVNPGKALDFNKITKLADIDLKELKRLNPAYRKTQTHPKGPQQLLLPIENVQTFKQNLKIQ